MDQLEKHPLDVKALNKGDLIDIAQLERITGEQAGTEAYRFAVLALRDWIMRERRRLGLPVTVASRKEALAILTDEEASEYNHRLLGQRIRQLFAAHLRQLDVDTGKLTDEQRKRHEEAVVNDSRLVQSLLAEKRKIALEPTRRTVPGITEGRAG